MTIKMLSSYELIKEAAQDVMKFGQAVAGSE